jgi:hypothetical protein
LRGAQATKQSRLFCDALDCFAEPVIGRRVAPTRWLAMTEFNRSRRNYVAGMIVPSTSPKPTR